MNSQASQPFDAEAYWKDKPRKKWVVFLENKSRKTTLRDTKIVSAATEAGAIRTAKFYTHLEKTTSVFCRLATPFDLRCTSSADGVKS